MTNVNLSQVRRTLVRLLKRYLGASEEERTQILRLIAETLVDAREHFGRPDGSPDWNGRTYPYRTWVRDAFEEAGVSREDVPTVQAAIRYHIGSVLRSRLDEDTLDAYGLIKRSPKERSADRRAERTAVVQALQARDVAGGALVALRAATSVLAQVEVKDFEELDPLGRAAADAALADLERRSRSFRRAISLLTAPAANGV